MGAVTKIMTPEPACGFSFEQVLYEAVVREGENLDGDDTEGYPFEPITLPSSPMSPPTAPDALPNLLPLPPSFSLEPAPSAPLLRRPPEPSSSTQPHKTPKCTRGSADDMRRKNRANTKRAMRRLEEKRATGYGDYVVKPRIINKYIRPAAAVDVKFDAMKLRHTKSAYTGGRIKAPSRRVYNVNELVGEDSIFKFKLKKWDGQYVTLFSMKFVW